MVKEKPNWDVKLTLEKRDGDINLCKTPEERLRFLQETKPYDVQEFYHNLLLNEGMDLMLSLLTGQGGTTFANATAQIGVGDSTTAAARTQTDLQAVTNKSWKGMESGFPTAPAENDATNGRSTKFKAAWGTGDGNFAWQEWSVRNDATNDKNLNRKVESLGTKDGGTWTLEVEISIS